MTTIAIKDGLVACDSQCTAGNYAMRSQKLFRLPDGGVAVKCGDAAAGYAGIKWLIDGERGDPPDVTGACVTIVRPDGSVWLVEERWPAYPILDRTYTSGCGQDLARQLMAQGKSPCDAVLEACALDAMSSPPVLYMAVLPERDDPGVQVYAPPKQTKAAGRKRKGKR